LDYTEVDVWSLGCTLFAILYGASPFECEFTRNRRGSTNKAPIRIVDCSQSRVLGNIPKPQPNTAVEKWYSPQVLELIDFILEKDRNRRPTLQQVQVRVKALLNGETVDVEDPMNSLFSKDRHDGW
jgi:serine/threonine kinase 16